MKTVIVGGVAAGASTGARLRRLDESAEIVILERDHYVSFANCGLPYHIGGEIPERQSLLLQTPESLGKSLALDVRTGQDVLRIDRDADEVEVRDVASGRTYRESYDKLVLSANGLDSSIDIKGGLGAAGPRRRDRAGAREAASRSTRRCAPPTPTSWRPETPWRRRTS